MCTRACIVIVRAGIMRIVIIARTAAIMPGIIAVTELRQVE